MHVALAITGAPLAARSEDLISVLDDAGHRITAVSTEASRAWTRIDDRWLPSGRIRPDVLIVVPATFNTLNKWAAGLNDTVVLGLLNDTLGLGMPILAVPMIADRLAAHPVWPITLARLTGAGVDLLDPTTGCCTTSPKPIASGTGEQIAARFQPAWIQHWLRSTER